MNNNNCPQLKYKLEYLKEQVLIMGEHIANIDTGKNFAEIEDLSQELLDIVLEFKRHVSLEKFLIKEQIQTKELLIGGTLDKNKLESEIIGPAESTRIGVVRSINCILSDTPKKIRIAFIDYKTLGVDYLSNLNEVNKKAMDIGFDLCQTETALYLGREDLHLAEGERFAVAMEPIAYGSQKYVFCLTNRRYSSLGGYRQTLAVLPSQDWEQKYIFVIPDIENEK
ncbi:MAG: hypothetical protein WCG01_02215 [bacterium]